MNRRPIAAPTLAMALALSAVASGQDARIRVRADRPGPEVSRRMTGVCIEDVNHEIYGGISSQMIFGESFQEPQAAAIDGFTGYGGRWTAEAGVLHAPAGDGPKLLADRPPIGAGTVAVQVRFPDDEPGLAGLIVKVGDPGVGADRFRGYEVSLDPSRQLLLLGRHRGNWEPIREVPCEVPVDRWVTLSAQMTEGGMTIRVDDQVVLEYEDREHPLPAGAVGLRTWKREADFRGLMIVRGTDREEFAFRPVDPHGLGGVSGMWRPVRRGGSEGGYAMETDRPFVGSQSQRIIFESGDGAIGVENRGLNRWGMHFEAGKPYEGALWIRADEPATVRVAAESGDGTTTVAEATLAVDGTNWRRYEFTLTPDDAVDGGRLAVLLEEPGSVVVGYASLEPGLWGRFEGLPVRKDVAEGLIRQGVTVMRLGGLMINAEGYCWKKMIGPRDRRPPYEGYWYPYSSNGWGIFEFLGFCEAAGILPVVAVNMDETPKDLADFLAYTNGPADEGWGRRRAEDGHPEPYRLRYLELGNEEAVDEDYWRRFEPLAEAAWAADPEVVLIVGDFEYREPVTDPVHVEGAPRITSLAAHRKILDLAESHDRQVWFDVHIWNQNPRDARGRIAALASFDAALRRLSPGADFRLCVLEENANHHGVRRAIAHGETINGLMRMGDRVRIVCAANALQPDGQNDNGWDQGFLFLNPATVWGQPPSYVTRMVTRNLLPRSVEAEVQSPGDALDVTALSGEDAVVLQVANVSDDRLRARIEIEGAPRIGPRVRVTQLTGELDEVNTVEDPERIVPWERSTAAGSHFDFTFAPRSFTILRLDRGGDDGR